MQQPGPFIEQPRFSSLPEFALRLSQAYAGWHAWGSDEDVFAYFASSSERTRTLSDPGRSLSRRPHQRRRMASVRLRRWHRAAGLLQPARAGATPVEMVEERLASQPLLQQGLAINLYYLDAQRWEHTDIFRQRLADRIYHRIASLREPAADEEKQWGQCTSVLKIRRYPTLDAPLRQCYGSKGGAMARPAELSRGTRQVWLSLKRI